MTLTAYVASLGTGAVIAVAPAWAQEAPSGAPTGERAPAESDASEIVVTGIRAGLDRATALKREADSVVDLISAEDVGRFPDVNVAESVQRITGVQINRTRGEGRTVNIRGLPANFTLATLNGRLLPNAISNAGDTASRAFDFTILPSEFIRTLAVYKAPTADLVDGGLAGTIDVKTAHPLDIGKRIVSASAQGEYESNSGKWAPRLSAFYSDVFADGRLGVSLGLAYMKRKAETHSTSVAYSAASESAGIPLGGANGAGDDLNGDGVITPGLRVRIPQRVANAIATEDNERLSAIGSLQYQASDALTLTLDGFYSRQKVQVVLNENPYTMSGATNVVSAETVEIDGLPTTTRFRVTGLDFRGNGRFENRASEGYSIVGGAKYDADGWLLALDGSYARSTQERDNLNIAAQATGEAEYIVRAGDPVGSLIGYNGFTQAALDPASFRASTINGDFNRQSSDRLWDIKGDIRREFGDSGLTAIRFGAHYMDRKFYQDNRQLTINGPGISVLAGGLPAGPIPNSFSAASLMKLIKAGNGGFLGSYKGSADIPTQWLASDTRGFVSRFNDAALAAAGTVTNDATGITDVAERTFAAYARGDFAFGQVSGNIGLRVVKTWQTTVGVSPDLTKITVYPDAGQVTRVPTGEPISVKRSYMDYLPSLNLKFEATENLQFRLSLSRTMTRPNLTEISPTTTANATTLSITQNNPVLDPFRANNADATVEWYFERDALLGASLFYKDLKSLIRRDTTVETLPATYIRSNGSTSQATLDFTVSRLVNGSGVTVKGFELYYQQAFRFLPAPLDGLGTVLNYTFIDNSDPTQLTAASKHNFNATGYYEKGPLGVRLSYSWRSGFLSAVGVTPVLNRMTKPFGTLDGSINVQAFKGVSVVLEAVNLLDTDERAFYTGDLPASYVDSGHRFFAGIRFSL